MELYGDLDNIILLVIALLNFFFNIFFCLTQFLSRLFFSWVDKFYLEVIFIVCFILDYFFAESWLVGVCSCVWQTFSWFSAKRVKWLSLGFYSFKTFEAFIKFHKNSRLTHKRILAEHWWLISDEASFQGIRLVQCG